MARILLVEPDIIIAKIYTAALQQAGYKVMWTCDAQTGIGATDSQIPDCILLELQLPRHNGIEFLYELRSHADLAAIPVVVLSHLEAEAIGMLESMQKELGIVEYLYKPATSVNKLVKVLRKVTPNA